MNCVIAMLVLTSFTVPIEAFFSKEKAFAFYNQGNVEDALRMWHDDIIHNENDCEALYNVGKVAYHDHKYEQARAYFSKVIGAPCLAALKKQAYFQRGYTAIHGKLWESALEDFEQVLSYESDHAQAQELIAYIKYMQEQEKQQQEKSHNEESQQEKEQNEHNEHKEQENSRGSSENDKTEEQSSTSDKDTQKEESSDSDSTDTNETHDEESAQNNKNQEGEKSEMDSPEPSERSELDQEEHGNEPHEQELNPQQHEADPKQEAQAAQHAEHNDADAQDPDEIVQLLQLLEKNDAQLSKQLLKKHINKEMPGQYGQKNW